VAAAFPERLVINALVIPDPYMEREMAAMLSLSGAALDRIFLAEMM
jgi:hypothetical protein